MIPGMYVLQLNFLISVYLYSFLSYLEDFLLK